MTCGVYTCTIYSVHVYVHFCILSLSTELARQAESAKLLEDKVRRAEAEAHELEMAKEQAEKERKTLADQAKKEKQESEASRRKMKEMEEKARRMAAEAEAKVKEVSDMQKQVHLYIVTLADCCVRKCTQRDL